MWGGRKKGLNAEGAEEARRVRGEEQEKPKSGPGEPGPYKGKRRAGVESEGYS
jgi:hypothetical protein